MEIPTKKNFWIDESNIVNSVFRPCRINEVIASILFKIVCSSFKSDIINMFAHAVLKLLNCEKTQKSMQHSTVYKRSLC